MKKIVLFLGLSLSLVQCSKDNAVETSQDQTIVNQKTNEQTLTFACSDLKLKDLANATNSSDFPIGIQFTNQQNTAAKIAHINSIVPEFDRTSVYFSMTEIIVRTGAGTTASPYVYSYNFNKIGNSNVNARILDAEAKGLQIHGTCLFYPFTAGGVAQPGYIPSFLTTFPNATQQNKDDFKKIITDYITAVTTNYAGRITSYDVTNELFDEDGIDPNNWVRKRFPAGAAGDDEFWAFIGDLFIAARAGDANADLFYLDYKTEDTGSVPQKGQAIVDRINTWKTNGAFTIPITGYGMQFHVYNGLAKSRMKTALALGATLGLKVHVAELDVQVNPGDNQSLTTPTVAMINSQRTTYKQAVEAYKESVPAAQRHGITLWDSSDNDTWYIKNNLRRNTQFEAATMYDKNFLRKPGYYGVAEGLSGTLYNECVNEYFLGIKKF
jgi:GH35 family endo-1,4-beta-xylanase